MKESMMTKHKDRARRLLTSLFTVLLIIGCIMVPDTQVQASSLALGVSASSVKIGDTVTVSITVPAGVSATVNVTYPSGVFSFSSASDTANANGGTVSMTIGSYGSSNTKTTGTMKFKAKAAGSATFSASAPIAGNQDGDRVTVGGASASVRVKNESNEESNNSESNTGTGNEGDNAGEDNTRKSADNSLASLTLSSGTLSPAFKYNVTNYTAEVANDVTSVVVSAKPSNANATVESVKGGENLVVGSNKIQIVVKAQNGVTATYTIQVTRKEAGATDEEDTPDQQDPDSTDVPQEQCYEVGGVKLYPSEEGDETQIPEGFAQEEITLWEKTYPYWVSERIGTDVGLIYLVDENKENGAWYRISEASPYEAHTFICLKSEYGYIIATPEKLTEAAPVGYASETINIEGKGILDAYRKGNSENDCLIYAVNQDGTYGWYRYDVQDRTYMRYQDEAPEEDTTVTEPSTEQDSAELNDLQSQNRLLFYAFLVVVTLLLIVIVVLIVKRRHGDDDDEDYEDEDYEDYDEEHKERVHVSVGETNERDLAERGAVELRNPDSTEKESYDVDDSEPESDLSDEHPGVHKRYDRSTFKTADDAKLEDNAKPADNAKPEDNAKPADDMKPAVNEADPLDLEDVLAQALSETMKDAADEDADEVIAEEPKENEKTSKLHRKKSYREEIEEAMDDFDDGEDDDFDEEDEEEKPKKKKERHGLFGRKKKNEDEDEDIEFLDL